MAREKLKVRFSKEFLNNWGALTRFPLYLLLAKKASKRMPFQSLAQFIFKDLNLVNY